MDSTSDAGKANAAADTTPPAELPQELPQVESPSVAPEQSETAGPRPVEGHRVSTAIAIYKGIRADASPDPAPSLFERLKARAQLPPLAAAVVLTLGMGVLAGSIGMVGVSQLFEPPHDAATREAALKDTLAQLSAEIDALKAAQATAVKTASNQMTRLSERLDKAERAQSEPSAKVAKLSDTVSQLERRVIAASSGATAAAVSGAPISADQVNVTGAVPTPRAAPAKDIARLPVVQGWVLQRVIDGTAIIYSREGMIEVGIGAGLPGGGRVEDIRRHEGRWIVVTSRGLVTTR